MSVEKVETLVIGGGQAGLAMSEHLSKRGVPHLVVERNRITKRVEDGVMHFAPDLAENIARGDANYLSVLDAADAQIARHGLDFPEEPEARQLDPDPACVTDPLLTLDLAREGVTSIIWATGYALDFSWLRVDAFDDKGRPDHARGVSKAPGLYFLGLAWLTRRASPFIWGVWHDADYLAGQVAERHRTQGADALTVGA
jgi:putative flavoprotein involved in K+ transport